MTAFIGRREFITLLGGAAAVWPVAARAQQPERIRKVGALLRNRRDTDPEARARVSASRERVSKKLGWAEGRNIQIEVSLGPYGW